MHAKPDLRVVLEWMIAHSGCSGPVISVVILLNQKWQSLSQVARIALAQSQFESCMDIQTETTIHTDGFMAVIDRRRNRQTGSALPVKKNGLTAIAIQYLTPFHHTAISVAKNYLTKTHLFSIPNSTHGLAGQNRSSCSKKEHCVSPVLVDTGGSLIIRLGGIHVNQWEA